MSPDQAKQQRRTETRLLSDLIPFPDQPRYFSNLEKYPLARLSEDISQNGLQSPIEILPPNKAGLPAGTIVSGHQRLRAVQQLGWTEVPVIVRHDLADVDRATIVKAFLQANLNRRHMSKLAQARIVRALYAAEQGKSEDQLSANDVCVRDRVGQQIGMSGRNSQRYLRVLETPLAVQRAVETGKLPLVGGSRVAGLSRRQQAAIVTAINNGVPPKAAVEQQLRAQHQKTATVDDDLRGLLRSLARCADIEPRIDQTSRFTLRRNLPLLKQGKRVLRRLIERAERKLSLDPPVLAAPMQGGNTKCEDTVSRRRSNSTAV